jgi:DNA-directed RNA polymerase specialized sigma24 family protein
MRTLKQPPTSFETRLHAVRAGSGTFADFVAATGDDWRKLAHHFLGRWSVPDAVEALDVEQEMLIGAWLAVGSWDPSRGNALDVHVRWRAITAAKKWIHRQRDALRRDDNAPSRHPVSFATLGTEAMDDRSSMPDSVERDVARLRLFGSALATVDRFDAACVLAVIDAAGNVAEAATVVNSNPTLKLWLRIDSEIDARRVICRAIERVAQACAA